MSRSFLNEATGSLSLYNAITKLVENPCCNKDISFETILKQFYEYRLVLPVDKLIEQLLKASTKIEEKKKAKVGGIHLSVQSFNLQDSSSQLTPNGQTLDSATSSTEQPKAHLKRLQSMPLFSRYENRKQTFFLTQAEPFKHTSWVNHENLPHTSGRSTELEDMPFESNFRHENSFLQSITDVGEETSSNLRFHLRQRNDNSLPKPELVENSNDGVMKVRGSRVAASRDNWVVDPETAAFINLNSRGVVDTLTEDKIANGLLMKSLKDTDVVHLNSNWFDQQMEELTEILSTQQYEAERLLSNIRHKPFCLSSEARQRIGTQTKKEFLLRGVLAERNSRQGYSTHWCSPVDLALTTCLDADQVETTRLIASVLTLRDIFLYNYGEIDSSCVFPGKPPTCIGQGSTEPEYDVFRVPLLPPCDAAYRMENGVFHVYWQKDPEEPQPIYFPTQYGGGLIPFYEGKPLLSWKRPVPPINVFLSALKYLMNATQHPGCKTFAFRRLVYLRNCYNMHQIFNGAAELQEVKENIHRDFYNVRKVDTHVHHSACMHQKHLLRFIRKKYRTEPNQIVARSSDGSSVSLGDIFDSEVGITAWEASVDLLNVHALGSCFHRFDKFNSKYNPFGQPLLREVFLKTDNLIQGRYLAEITKEVVADLEDGKYQFVEWRISIYGKSYDEWKKLTTWISSNGLTSKQVRWMIQVPRLFHVYQKLNLVNSFADFLHNIFDPLFQAAKDPASHPEIYRFLLQMNGWDSVDDESIVSKYTSDVTSLPPPEKWTESANPPYSYWAYYMYANIQNLNQFLVARGLRPFPFRPHCGEAGSISHLASMFLLADEINHGIMLRKSPLLQYLYYLRQIGLAVSPLSNNALFHPIIKNPFYDYFAIGMNVSLSSDDPLMFHFTDEALLEEYSCCAHVWRLSPVDLCEIARNSVLQSYFEPQFKKHWLGENYYKKGKEGNDISRTNVSNIRLMFRHDILMKEWRYLRDVLQIDRFLDHIVSKITY